MTITYHDFTHLEPFIKNYKGKLTEGITYNPSNNTLLWVDIIKGEIHRVILTKDDKGERSYSNHQHFVIPNETIGVIYLTTNDDIVLVGSQFGIAEYHFSSEKFQYKLRYDSQDVFKSSDGTYKLRSNDGGVDSNGNIWQGLMGNFTIGPIDDGSLVKITPNGDFKKVEKSLIPNGINWSKDGKTLYWTSSLELTIYKFDYDPINQEISNKTPFINFKQVFPDFDSPEPDGFTLNSKDEIYTVVWSTSSVVHFNTNGEVIEIFKLPTNRVSCCFFGPDNELFINTANINLENDEPNDDLGGSIFRLKIDDEGITKNKLKYPFQNIF
ncbi:hypothetical protein WICMUC_002305 [Wickerhamomyces mucosus]|uniref:SMP-30/Gluconolactonase/LRE-like region domain-containing protein n=1 Tax=Wickerhamomyces mucosus TaxID=1378264 RepID=A0A9P8TEN0_9ASCO|nr:hypothetical protein WICMUC_002305 [Wickerhamomyces mucosus]